MPELNGIGKEIVSFIQAWYYQVYECLKQPGPEKKKGENLSFRLFTSDIVTNNKYATKSEDQNLSITKLLRYFLLVDLFALE